MEAFGKFVAIVISAGIQTIYLGFAVAKLWAWFVVPLGVPAVDWRHGLGIAILVSITAHQYVKSESKGVKEIVAHSVTWCLAYSTSLAFGWLVK